jgi:hypothetical protein
MHPNQIEYLPQFTAAETCLAGVSGRLQPESHLVRRSREMRMTRLVTFEAEEKTTASLTEQCRPLRRLYRLDSARSACTQDAGMIGVKP